MPAHDYHTPQDLIVRSYMPKCVALPLRSMLHDQQLELGLYEVEQLDSSSTLTIKLTSLDDSRDAKLHLQSKMLSLDTHIVLECHASDTSREEGM
jgi:hypothetical protein